MTKTSVATKTMKAVRFHAYGDPGVLKLEDVPRPEPVAGEVLVRVQAVGVNPIDWKVRAGFNKERYANQLPIIVGWDVSGIVVAKGAGVADFKIGDEVYGRLDTRRDGAYAEYVVSRAQDLTRRPESIDAVTAAAVPLAALTAWQALFDTANLSASQTVLIQAAAGGVGHFAVQLAHWKGARVIGTASARNAAFVRELGADEVVDYRTTRFEEVVQNVDVVLDAIAGQTQELSLRTLKPGGILVSLLGITSEESAARRGVRIAAMHVRSDSAQLAQITDLIDAGVVKPTITTLLPLSEAATAHRLSQTGHIRGKIVLRVSE